MSLYDKSKRDLELDDFWDLERLVPKKENRSPQVKKNPMADMTADIVIPPVGGTKDGSEDNRLTEKSTVITHYVYPHTAENEKNKPAPELEYYPKDSLIHKVEIYPWKNKYTYYDQFDNLAHRYYGKRMTREVENVPFFSYIPHYGHMNRAQLEWFVFWRERALSGEYVKTSYSYVLLLVYEILAVSDILDGYKVQDMLCRVWRMFRGDFPQMDKFMGDWIADFSIINQLEPPALPEDMLEAVMSGCILKEYFIPCKGRDYSMYADIVAKYCSSYDYKKSKFYNDANKELYDKHIINALEYVMSRYSEAGRIFSAIGLTDSHIAKDAFVGAICTHRMKKKIEIDFSSFSRTNDLRYTVGSIIKHCENRIRAYLGIKSKFNAIALHVGVRACLDEYFDANLSGVSKAVLKKREEAAEYEKHYELPKTEFSREKAEMIEAASWRTTEMLVETFSDEKTVDEPKTDESPRADMPVSEPVTAPFDCKDGSSDLDTDMCRFLEACLYKNNADQKQIARERGSFPDAMADEINEIFADRMGDVILCENDGANGYEVIPEYEDTALSVIKNGGRIND